VRLTLWSLLTALAAPAEEHALLGTDLPELGAREIPEGAPQDLRVEAGADLSAAIRALPAGSTLTLAPGDYAGPLLIDRPLRLLGEGATLRGTGRGTVLMIRASDVLVRGLRLSGSGSDSNAGDAGILVAADRVELDRLSVEDAYIGIDLRQANDNHIHDCTIRGRAALPMGLRGDGLRMWESDRNRVERNRLDSVRDLVVWYSYDNVLSHNTVVHGRYGTHFMHASDNTVADDVYEDDVVGVFVMYSDRVHLLRNRVVGARGEAGVGFGFKESDDIEVRENALIGDTTGIYLDGTPHRVDGTAVFADNLIAYNHTGLRLHGRVRGAVLRDNDLHENGLPVTADGGADARDVRFEGNRWSEYEGYDLDDDGVGDVPFVLRGATNGMLDRHPDARFFTGTPAAALLDLLAAAFPMLAPPPLLEDPQPRVGGPPLVVGPADAG